VFAGFDDEATDLSNYKCLASELNLDEVVLRSSIERYSLSDGKRCPDTSRFVKYIAAQRAILLAS
jgi:hypothetical protein